MGLRAKEIKEKPSIAPPLSQPGDFETSFRHMIREEGKLVTAVKTAVSLCLTSLNLCSSALEGTFSAMAMQMFLRSASRAKTSIPDSPAGRKEERNYISTFRIHSRRRSGHDVRSLRVSQFGQFGQCSGGGGGGVALSYRRIELLVLLACSMAPTATALRSEAERGRLSRWALLSVGEREGMEKFCQTPVCHPSIIAFCKPKSRSHPFCRSVGWKYYDNTIN